MSAPQNSHAALLLALSMSMSALVAPAYAADLRFTAVLNTPVANLAPNNLPASYTIASNSPSIADQGAGDLGFLLTNAAAANGHWSNMTGPLRQFAAINVADATGPGRTGAEAGHVFFEWNGASDSSGNGRRSFIARAGSQLQPASVATWGVYQFNGTANAEIARVGNVGALGPNLAAGWQFNTSGNPFDRVLPVGTNRVVITATVDSPTNSFLSGIVMHVTGTGNVGCAAINLTGPLAPGANLTFNQLNATVASKTGQVYTRGRQVDSSFINSEGIWRICDGSPVAKALSRVTGPLGPGLAVSTGIFTQIQNSIAPAVGDSLYFGAAGQETVGSGAVPFDGIFHHDGSTNTPVALRSVQGPLGPKFPGFVFSQFSGIDLQAAGPYGLMRTFINGVVTTSDSREGLWRVTRSGGAEPIALIATDGALAPNSTRRWSAFFNQAIVENGDVLVIANTNLAAGGDLRRGLWRLRPNRAPESVMTVGDRVTVNTASGPQLLAITEVTTVVPGFGLTQAYAGEDAWVNSDGSALVEVNLAGYGNSSFYVRGLATNADVSFADGFE
jgi:hypothetical protein